ncbi:MAG: hypothetical protein KUG56_07830 [Kordiimonadaceae bacterium]|nr:hypothetical protein [Kordiimonadaceae bacterium]
MRKLKAYFSLLGLVAMMFTVWAAPGAYAVPSSGCCPPGMEMDHSAMSGDMGNNVDVDQNCMNMGCDMACAAAAGTAFTQPQTFQMLAILFVSTIDSVPHVSMSPIAQTLNTPPPKQA